MLCEVSEPRHTNTLSFNINIKFFREEIVSYTEEIGLNIELNFGDKMVVNFYVVYVRN